LRPQVLYKRDLDLAELVFTCDSVEMLNRFATTFNYMYKVALDHMTRMQELSY